MSDRPSPDWPWFFRGLHTATALAAEEAADTRRRLERARTLMHERLDEALDLDTAARQALLSRFHFARAFRRAFDVTPHQYLTRLRLERAKALLGQTDLSVTEVCLEVGFSSLGSFSTLFSRHVGASPHRYRRTVVQSLGIPAGGPPIPACFLAKFAAVSPLGG